MPKWEGPWPWWKALPLFIAIVVVFWGMWALPLIWAPLAIIPIGIIAWGIIGSFKANLRGRK